MNDLELQEMKSQISFMVKKYQDTMAKYDEVSEIVSSNSNSFLELSQSLNNLYSKNDSQMSMLTSLKSKLEGGVTEIFSLLEKAKESVNSLSSQHNDVKNNIFSINTDVHSVKDDLYKCVSKQENFSLKNETEKLSKDLQILKQDVCEKIDSHKNIQNTLQDQIFNIKSFLDVLKNDVSECLNSYTQTLDSLKTLSQSVESHKSSIASLITNMGDALRNEMDEKISCIPIPEIPNIDDAKNELMKKIEPAVLDARNANLRSSNNEGKITLLEKKLEQAQLILQKLQLQG